MGFEVIRPCTRFPCSINFQRLYPTSDRSDHLDKGYVIPIPKIPSPQDITKDLRPISLTSTLSKICERFVTDWLLEHIKEKIGRRQFGSLKNTSTTHALSSFAHHLPYETDIPRTAVRVFLIDFSKAFDVIDHIRNESTIEKYKLDSKFPF